MPYKPAKPCKIPNCPAKAGPSGYCPAHEAALPPSTRNPDDRPSASQRGYNSRWQRARLAYLRAHPLCVKCRAEGRVEVATVVDHIIPHRGDWELFWDRDNWQSLCETCHNKKTARGL